MNKSIKYAMYIGITAMIVSCVANTPKMKPDVVSTPEQLAELQRWTRVEAEDRSGVNCKKTGTSFIGEHQQRTTKCGWGKPNKINRTTNAGGTREQWVYGGHNYLYFQDGILISMQN